MLTVAKGAVRRWTLRGVSDDGPLVTGQIGGRSSGRGTFLTGFRPERSDSSGRANGSWEFPFPT